MPPSTETSKTSEASDTPALDARIGAAFTYVFPLHDLARTRWQLTQGAGERGAPPNRLHHNRRLLNHRARQVTMPNNDTLYTSAWLDLAAGPVTLSLPPMGARYYSVALLDAFTNNFACLGPRTCGEDAHVFVITGPAHTAPQDPPAGTTVVRAPCNDVWLLARVLVDGEADLPAVHALQDGMSLVPAGGIAPVPFATTPDEADPAAFLALVNEALGRNGVPADERQMVEGFDDLGIRAGERDAWHRLAPSVRDAWSRLYPGLRRRLEQPPRAGAARAETRQGPRSTWQTSPDHIGNYGTDYAYRAFIALVGLGALERAEAIYATALTDAGGEPFDGARRYRLRVPAEMPVNAFWSLTMYEFEPDGRRFFTQNTLDRFAIGDRTAGLRRDADGSFEIAIQHREPAEGSANWLPAPAGRFSLALRYYHPREALLQHAFTMPDVAPLPD